MSDTTSTKRRPKKQEAVPGPAAPKRTSRATSSREKKDTDRRNKVALLIAVATAIGAIGTAVVTGIFQIHNVDDRLKNLGPIQMEGDTWAVGYGNSGWTLGTPSRAGDPVGGVPQNSRIFYYHINFKKRFSSPPKVIISVTQLDEWRNGGVRWIVSPANVSNDGFDISIQAQENAVIYVIGGSWVAFQR